MVHVVDWCAKPIVIHNSPCFLFHWAESQIIATEAVMAMASPSMFEGWSIKKKLCEATKTGKTIPGGFAPSMEISIKIEGTPSHHPLSSIPRWDFP